MYLDTQDKRFVPVGDDRIFHRISNDIGALVAVDASAKPVESHRDELSIKQCVEQVLECLSYTVVRNRDLPKIALEQIWMRLHSLLD